MSIQYPLLMDGCTIIYKGIDVYYSTSCAYITKFGTSLKRWQQQALRFVVMQANAGNGLSPHLCAKSAGEG